ncbi:hypothetical protein LLG95_00270 [bacterium]|nr:hypothetical protein [bacterium]
MNRRLTKRDAIFYAAILLVAGALFVGGVLAGHRLLVRGYLWPANILFGMDAERNIRNLTESGFNDRSNVHPFFTLIFKPVGRAVIRCGITPGTAGVVVNAAAGALAVLLFALYLRMRGIARAETVALALLFAASTTLVIESAVPTTFLFSLFVIIATHLLLIHSWRRERDVLLEIWWLIAGLVNYGVTITAGFLAFLAYGFSRRDRRGWLHSFFYGAAVFGLGLVLTFMVGSLMNITAERQFLFGYKGPYNPFLALIHTLSSFLAWNVVAPIPQISVSDIGVQLLTFQSWHYTPLGWLMLLLWIALFACGLWAALVDRDESSRRFSAALAASLGFAILLHVFYYVGFEGNFQFSGQYQFFVIGLLAPLAWRASQWPSRRRAWFLILLIAFSICLAARHYNLIWHTPDLVPLPGQ